MLNPAFEKANKLVDEAYDKAMKQYKKWLLDNKENIKQYKQQQLDKQKQRRIEVNKREKERLAKIKLRKAQATKRNNIRQIAMLKVKINKLSKAAGVYDSMINRSAIKSLGTGRKIEI